MPAKSKKNYRAMAHSDTLADLSATTHKAIVKGAFVSINDLNMIIEHAQNLKRELFPTLANTSDPFLTEEPKSDVARLPTIQVPAVEKPVVEKQKSGFLGR